MRSRKKKRTYRTSQNIQIATKLNSEIMSININFIYTYNNEMLQKLKNKVFHPLLGFTSKNPTLKAICKSAAPNKLENVPTGNCIDHTVTLYSKHFLLGARITILITSNKWSEKNGEGAVQ